MAGFRKAKAEQAFIKMGIYGNSGSGKTFTSLLLAEGLAKPMNKRIAFVDTERGTDFYCQKVPERTIHPEEFDFDALYTRSLLDVAKEIKALKPEEYGVVIIDSMTHIWDAAKLLYTGKQTKIGGLPYYAWNVIKKPYKDLLAYLLSIPMHVIICGRQSNEFEEDEESGELKKTGVKMAAEGQTQYEPHILLHMYPEKNKTGQSIIRACIEKDRTGILTGKVIYNPNFDNIIKPVTKLLGTVQANIQSEDDIAKKDGEEVITQEAEKDKKSKEILNKFKREMVKCDTIEQLDAVSKLITPAIKKEMTTEDVATLREAYIKYSEVIKNPNKIVDDKIEDFDV